MPLFADQKPAPPEADVKEVGNYVRAMEYGLDRLHSLPVSLRLIRELHERLMEGVRGEQATPGTFAAARTGSGVPGCTLNEAEFVPRPCPKCMRPWMPWKSIYTAANTIPHSFAWLSFTTSSRPSIPSWTATAASGGLLTMLLLVSWDLLPLPLLYLSVFFEAHRQTYYDTLLAVSERGAWPEWVRFFLKGVAEQARDAGARAKRLQDLQSQWRERLVKVRGSALLLRLIDSLFASPVLTIPQVQHLLGITYRSAKANVEKLVQVEILKQSGESYYGKTYFAPEIIEAII